MKVDELISLEGHVAVPPAAPTREELDEITAIYYDVYMPGLNSFFETTWYSFRPQGPHPISTLLTNKPVTDLLARFLKSLESAAAGDAGEMTQAGTLETRVVWALASLAYTTPAAINPNNDTLIPADNAAEARNRVAVFETLLSGGSLTSNPCVPPPKGHDTLRLREFDFWWCLAEYLRLQNSPQNDFTKQRDDILTRMRNLLDGRENRDVLYSLAVLRELSPRFPASYETDLPQHLEESDARNRLAVAAQFIRSEALTRGGTTNVVRRFTDLALRAFVNPGVNLSRRA